MTMPDVCRHCGAPVRPSGSAWIDRDGWELCTDPDHTFHEPEGEPVTTTTVQQPSSTARMMEDFLAVLADEPGSTIADIGRLIEAHLLPIHEGLVRERVVQEQATGRPNPPTAFVHEQPRRDGGTEWLAGQTEGDGAVKFTVTRMNGGTGTQLAIDVPASQIDALVAGVRAAAGQPVLGTS